LLYKNNENPNRTLPLLALITLSLQRILPILQQIFSNWSTLISSIPTLNDTLVLLDMEKSIIKISKSKFAWDNCITLHNISFKYKTRDQLILKDLNLVIKKNSKVAIIGESGQGKSTLIDIISGLLSPAIGEIKIDNTIISNDSELTAKWRNEISVVSQRIFLTDKTLLENIAFGIDLDDIDFNKINRQLNSPI
jgi:ATP-binding cassette subfamily B protein